VAAIDINAFVQSKPTIITGAWRLTEITTTGPGGSTNRSPQPSLFLFAESHYSILYIEGDRPRAALPNNATADDLRAFVAPFVANAGTYEIKNGTLTTRPIVAKVPAVMAAGNFISYSFKVEGNTLILTYLTNESSPNSPANPTTLKLTRVE